MSDLPASFAAVVAQQGRTRWLRVLVTVLVLALGLTFQLSRGDDAGASPTTAFEIDDANIVDGAAAPLDWGSVFGRDPVGGANAPVVVKNTTGLITASFAEDPMSQDSLPVPPCDPGKKGDLTTLVAGGSDKNGDAINTWEYESNSVPDSKDDITNVYAAAKDDSGNKIFYFGLDRSNTNGSSHFDFEFLKAPMGLNPTGKDSSGCPAGNVSGSRTVGDMLVSMNFTNGGSVGLEDIRVWDGDSYETQSNLGGKAGLFSNENGPVACGDWRCRDSAGATVTQLPANGLLEGYVDATALGVSGCFSSFNVKSRTSHSWSSELKDFVIGNFNTCDANISITPNGVNEVNDAHTFTGHVNVNPNGPFVNAPAGTIINFAKVSGPGSFVNNISQCATIGTTGSCSVSITSASSGVTVVSASTTVQVGPLTLSRSTNGNPGAGGSGNAVKKWVDGYIKVTPDDVNPVNEQHVFTVEFGVLPGGADKVENVAIAADVTPNPDVKEVSTCGSPTKVGNTVWQCTITINSSVTGVFTANATGTADVSKTGIADVVQLKRSTDANVAPKGPNGSGPATKTYVDARITVGPDGLNEVNDDHTVTATLETKDGNGAWTKAPAGTVIDFAKVSGPGGFVGDDDDCTTVGTTGSCSVAIDSATVGVTVVSATATISVHGVSLKRSTDANTATNGPGGSGNLHKKWADASIKILDNGFNEVNDDHVFTVTATAHAPTGTSVTFDSITPSVDPTPGDQKTTCDSPVLSAGGLVATCTYTINNAEAGSFDVDAAVAVTFDDGDNDPLTVNRSTKGNAGPNGNQGSTKKFVDARVSVGPDGVNAVGDDHTVTGKAEFNDATGWKPAVGETINFAITQGVGGFVNGVDSCVAGADGTCSVQIESDVPGVTWVSASTSYDVLTVLLNRTTAVSGATDADNLRKEWVAAEIEITPSAVNPVDEPHTFDIKVKATSSGAAISFGDVGTTVTPAPDSKSDTCAPADREVNGGELTCTLTINSATAGIFTANATAQVTIGDVVFNLATNGQGGSGPAVKTYVDARISVGPDGVNAVGDPHPVNAHLEVNDGTGWVNAPAGVTIDLAILSGPGSLTASSCVIGAGGACGVTLNSNAAGTTIVTASATVDVEGVALSRSTNSNAGPGGSDNLTKQWVNASVAITPDGLNPVGEAHVFTVTAKVIPAGLADVSFDSIVPSVTPAPDSMSTTCGSPVVANQTATCTVTINNDETGVFTAHVTADMTIGGVKIKRSTNSAVAPAGPDGSGPATKAYVDSYIKVTPDGVNPVGEAHVFDVEFGVMPGGADNVSDVAITADVTPNPGTETSTCNAPTPAGSNKWTCTITINNSATGVFTANAAGTAKVTKTGVADVVTITRSTNSQVAPHGPGGTGPATKTYVDARITVGPNGLNEVNDPHTVTGTVETKDGNGPWTKAPEGTVIDFAKAAGPGGFVGFDSDCATVGDTGACSVQINSADVGSTVVSATATVSVHGVSLKRSTDSSIAPNGPEGSGNMTKKWADASINVVESAVNEVNEPHVFTITATAHRPSDETVAFVSITPTAKPVPGTKSTTCADPVISGGGLVATCTYTINSAAAGLFDVDATAVVTFDDGTNPKLSITRSTDPAVAPAGPNGNEGATKRYVDARVSVGPDGVNAVGDPHTVTGKAEQNDASGWAPAVGETIHFAITQGVGGFVNDVDSCTAGADGTCSVAIVSDEPGVTWVSASTSYDVFGVVLNRTTAVAGATDADNLRKEWVDAAIEITPSAVNPVGVPHTFDVKVTASSSGAAIEFGAVATSVTPAPDAKSDTCAPDDREVEGGVLTCTLTINNNEGGIFTANATATVTIGGVVFNLATNGQGGSGPAVKTYVGADIQVGPDGVNAVGDPHLVTGHVNIDEGSGKVNAPAGTLIDFAIVSGPGSLTATGCATVGTTGSCSVTLNSSVAGVTIVSASSDVNVKGVLFELTTDGEGANSDDLTKRWVDAFITIGPDGVNPLNQPHTFTVKVTPIPSGAAPVTFDSITVAVTPAPSSQTDTCATPDISGGVATCTLTINSSSAGVFTANATAVVSMGGAKVTRSTDATVAPAGPGGSGPATKTYVPPVEVQGVQFLPRTGAFLMSNLRLAALLLFLGVLGLGYGLFGIQKRRRTV